MAKTVSSIDHAKISRVLAGELETTVLNEAEKGVWSEQFRQKMAEPGPEEEAFFAELRARMVDRG